MAASLPVSHHIDRRAHRILGDGPGNDDDLLSNAETAEWLGYSKAWLEIGRSRGYGPKFIRLSPRRIRYRRGDVRQWLKQRTHQATVEYVKKFDREADAESPAVK